MKEINCFVKKIKKVGKFEIETPSNVWIDEFVCLRSKAYSYKYGKSTITKLKGISKSQTKKFKFEEDHQCLFGGDYKKD